MEDNRAGGTIGLITGLTILSAGAIASVLFARKLADRREGGDDDAPDYTRRRPSSDTALVGRTVTIAKERGELYRFWRDFDNLARFMENVEEVREDGDIDIWVIKAPGGQHVEVKTRVIEEIDGEKLAWQSIPGTDIAARGEVTFEDAPGDRGTLVAMRMSYDPPAGALGRLIAKVLMREPEVQARHDLKRFKMLMETGEITTSARRRGETRAARYQEKAA